MFLVKIAIGTLQELPNLMQTAASKADIPVHATAAT
jgi:hypothetical protein